MVAESPGSARGKVMRQGSLGRSAHAKDESPSTPRVLSPITKNKATASPAGITIDNSFKPIGGVRVQRKGYRQEVTRPKSDGASRPAAQEATTRSSEVIPVGKKPAADIDISSSGLGAANPVQMGPPIILRAVKGTQLQTKAQNATLSEIVNERGAAAFANASKSSPIRHDAPNPHGLASEPISYRREAHSRQSADSASSSAKPSLSDQIASGVSGPVNRLERPANAQLHCPAETTGHSQQIALKSMNSEANEGSHQTSRRNDSSPSAELNGVMNLPTGDAPVAAQPVQRISDPPLPSSPLLLRKNGASEAAKTRPLDSEVIPSTTEAAAPTQPRHSNVEAQLARAANSAAEGVSSTKRSPEPSFSDRGLEPALNGQQRVNNASIGGNFLQDGAIAVSSNQPESSERSETPETLPSAPIDGWANRSSVQSKMPFAHRKETTSLASSSEKAPRNPPSASPVTKDAVLPLDSLSSPAKTSGPALVSTDSIKESPDTVRTIASAISSSPSHSSLVRAKKLEAGSLDSKLHVNDVQKVSRADRCLSSSTPIAVGSTPQAPIEIPLSLTLTTAKISRQSGNTIDSGEARENLALAGHRLSRSKTDLPATVLGSGTAPPVTPGDRIHRGSADHRVDPGLSTSFVRQPLVSSNAEIASVLLRKVVQHRDVTMAESPSRVSTPGPVVPGNSTTRDRVWARTELALAQPKLNQATINHEIPNSQGSMNRLLRSAANSTSVEGGQAASLPSLSAKSGSTPQSVSGVDLGQLTNRVYEMLVRRLASEKQRRGL